MQTIEINSPIQLRCVRAESFPNAVMPAFQRLHQVAPPRENRVYISVSWLGDNQQIEYLAGATELEEGEMNYPDFESFTVQEGTYIYMDIPDFMKDIPAIGQAFSTLLALPETATDTVCIEWYMSDTVCRCMVRKK
ncbi:MAG: hypothetical protein MUC87_00940 [Bacteroidia bacterium]|jgi:hypothetical protein|nr:hypothetical protein [Bacteroidia bacterium]